MVADMTTVRDSNFWRHRADEARGQAEQMISQDGKTWMLEIARLYDMLADRQAKHEASGKNPYS
jgi:hypothetical protein